MSWVRGHRYAAGQKVDPAALAEDNGLSYDSASGLWVPRPVHQDRIEVTQPWNNTLAVQGIVSSVPNGSALGGGIVYNGSATQNDEFAWDLLLRKGTWAFGLVYAALNSDGIMSWRLDGVEFASVDGYNVSGVRLYNGFHGTAGIVVATTGVKRVSVKVADKNPASSAYYMAFQHFNFRRTGA